jgi:CRISPR-associated endonuclease Csn1
MNSKNVILGNGTITALLRQDWGLDHIWNDLIMHRFERMNELTKTNLYTAYNERHQKNLPTVPLEFSKGFQKKRIDHRHHAMDALVMACVTRDHVNLLNNMYAKSPEKRYDLARKLRHFKKASFFDRKTNVPVERDVPGDFIKPWKTFTTDARDMMEKMIVSFKQNLRVINKATNRYFRWEDENGVKTKKSTKQLNVNWAIRKSLHKETVSGLVHLQQVKTPKGKVITATRKKIDQSFDDKAIESITDTGIQKILKNYLATKGGNPEYAFSPEGLEDMNRFIERYNDGKPHKPILKARIFETGSKFALGQSEHTRFKYVEAAKGTNLFFAVYWDKENQKRNFETIPLNEVIEHQKWRASLNKEMQKNTELIPVKSELGRLLFYLSPNDLVYLPENGEDLNLSELIKPTSIYKAVSFTGNRGFFLQHHVAYSIVNKMEFSTLNKMERSVDGRMVKETCIKIEVDRLGKITKWHVPKLE